MLVDADFNTLKETTSLICTKPRERGLWGSEETFHPLVTCISARVVFTLFVKEVLDAPDSGFSVLCVPPSL